MYHSHLAKPSDMTHKPQPTGSKIVLIVLGLAAANSFAYSTSSISQFYGTASLYNVSYSQCQWGIPLNSLGLGLGVFPTIYICHRIHFKYLIAIATFLLSLCCWAPILFRRTFGVLLCARLFGGICAAVQIYTSLLMFAGNFDGLVGTNKAVMTFATTGGIGAGPYVGRLAPRFFGYSSTFVVLLTLAIPSRISLDRPERSSEEPSSEPDPSFWEMFESKPFPLSAPVALGWTLLCILFFAMYIGSWSYGGIVVGAGATVLGYRGEKFYKTDQEKTDPKRFSYFYILEGLGTVLSLQAVCWLIWDFREDDDQFYSHPVLGLVGFIFGACMTRISAAVLTIQVDLCALRGKSCLVEPAMGFVFSSIVLLLLLGIINTTPYRLAALPYIFLDCICWLPHLLAVCAVYQNGVKCIAKPEDEEIELQSLSNGGSPTRAEPESGRDSQAESSTSATEARIARLEQEILSLRARDSPSCAERV